VGTSLTEGDTLKTWTTLGIAAALILAFVGVALAVPDCAVSRCVYLPLITVDRSPTPIPTAGPTSTNTLEATATRTSTPTVTNTPPPTSTPTLPPPSFNNCQADPNPNAAPNYPVRIVTIDKVAETVTLQNISGNAIDLTLWHMCSITGNQEHPIGGILNAGATQTYPNTGGPIWNNSSPDPGALYTPSGQLASYFNS